MRRGDGRLPTLAVWGGFECSVVRIGERYRDQLRETGHWSRPHDLDAAAALGIGALRYPVLIEHVAPHAPDVLEWGWHDARLRRLRDLDVEPIVGLVHHGSGPRYTDLLDPGFAEVIARYAARVARRYPWVRAFTPVNEPGTTARFACLYGHWYPHLRSTPAFLRALFHQCRASALAMREIREVTPDARLVQTEDVGRTYATPALAAQARYEGERRWLAFDLLCGRVDRRHPFRGAFEEAGVPARQLDDLVERPCPPDVFGVNHYLTSDRFLDQRLHRYPAASWGGNGRQRYADVEAVRVARRDLRCSPADRLRETWARYGGTVALTECHNGSTREEQLRWFAQAHSGLAQLQAEGVDVAAITVWAIAGAVDWSSLLTRRNGDYEPGPLDARSQPARRTALARLVGELAAGRTANDPALGGLAWWRRDDRFLAPSRGRRACAPAMPQRPLLITGATGTLGRAFARACERRSLAYLLTGREILDLGDAGAVAAALRAHAPWAVINAAGYVRVERAESEPERCRRENCEAAANLAAACAAASIPLVTFSSDLVFDGSAGRAYVERDPVAPRSVYGRSKAEAEQRVLAAWPRSLVVRTSAFFGPVDRYNFVHGTLDALRRGERVVAPEAVRVSPTYVPDLVDATLDLVVDGAEGLWHLANAGETSWADLARSAARRAGFDPDRIEGARGPRSSTALRSERARLMPSLESALDRFFRDSAENWAAASHAKSAAIASRSRDAAEPSARARSTRASRSTVAVGSDPGSASKGRKVEATKRPLP